MVIPFAEMGLFFGASLLLAFAPGPDNIFVLTQSALGGFKVGAVVTLGLCTGLLFHTAAVACGVAAIFMASATAFAVLKLAGAAYLTYLAWCAFRAGVSDLASRNGTPRSLGKLYRRGIIMNITNPKVSIFFLAFLPQFADPTRGSLTLQIICLGCLFIISALIVFGLISVLAGSIGDALRRSPNAQVILNRLAGTVFAGLALKLATSER